VADTRPIATAVPSPPLVARLIGIETSLAPQNGKFSERNFDPARGGEPF
jgi:hypothetical protein